MITYEQFVDLYPTNTEDDEIDSLFDLIEHQPKLGGLFGAKQSIYDDYNKEIFKCIKKLGS